MTQQCDFNQGAFPTSRDPSQPLAPTKGLCGKKSHREGCFMFYLHFLPHCGQQLGKSARV